MNADLPPRLTDDERDDLAQLAERAEQRNTPRSLVILAMIALLIAGAAVLAAWRRDASLRAELDRRDTELRRINDLAAEYGALQERLTQGAGQTGLEPIPDILTRLDAQATRAGVDLSGVNPSTSYDNAGEGLRRRRDTYSLQTDTIEAPLRWVRFATSEIPGLRVHRIQLQTPARANQNRWRLDITFARVERYQDG